MSESSAVVPGASVLEAHVSQYSLGGGASACAAVAVAAAAAFLPRLARGEPLAAAGAALLDTTVAEGVAAAAGGGGGHLDLDTAWALCGAPPALRLLGAGGEGVPLAGALTDARCFEGLVSRARGLAAAAGAPAGGHVGLVITKPPETVLLILPSAAAGPAAAAGGGGPAAAAQASFLFDSHPRANLGLPQAHLLCAADEGALLAHLRRIFPPLPADVGRPRVAAGAAAEAEAAELLQDHVLAAALRASAADAEAADAWAEAQQAHSVYNMVEAAVLVASNK